MITGTNTAIFDVAKEGTLEDMLEDPDHNVISTWTPEDKLRYAWQITKALADVHSVGNIYNSAAISHTDIGPSQYLWIDGMFKVSHFNRGMNFVRLLCHSFSCIIISSIFIGTVAE
jgi:serine/threonine protein kinase